MFHLELEQNYFNSKRWLLNRLVTGYGVVCGLDVQPDKNGSGVVVLPGVAIDKWGREIIVPKTTMSVPLPAAAAAAAGAQANAGAAGAVGAAGVASANACECCDGQYCHVVICYHECESDPVPALGGECDQNAMCTPGTIRERYEVQIIDGKQPTISTDCMLQDIVAGGRINYPALVQYVSAPCRACPDNPCIVLANVQLPQPGAMLQSEQIDITVRPLVFGLDLLHDLLVCLTNKMPNQDTARGCKG
ncbi:MULTISPECIES: hypothetical protein [unclassified Burkholderia]|uniref:hypothetical protein n=1 Tax=unclassified Burkholderia TaxID=2613784 RepID=UPI001424199D|nr:MULTISPECIES: hypothetical protein [unclassified Burkholderia]NIE61729.1 hypothetical protein [Burkholderia sp. Ap-955]NIF14243.1 hypothetical protein [Burkholderia sp. Ax-1735]NIG07444.1 hypothetical protein [Burkholderia sp. Tr-849]